ncbi:hypothetical protein P7266_0077 [Lactococcus cremoris]|nr:hypothetical protein P7266_0077 [Lactococcus cremoris]
MLLTASSVAFSYRFRRENTALLLIVLSALLMAILGKNYYF